MKHNKMSSVQRISIQISMWLELATKRNTAAAAAAAAVPVSYVPVCYICIKYCLD
jgi:hypothetical protein